MNPAGRAELHTNRREPSLWQSVVLRVYLGYTDADVRVLAKRLD